jgi:hypothetical protein
MNTIFLAWLVEVGIITARDLAQNKQLPLPSELLSSMIVFGAIGALSESSTFNTAAKTTAWGLVLATLLNTAAPKSANYGVLQAIGNFLAPPAGQTPKPAAMQKGGSNG